MFHPDIFIPPASSFSFAHLRELYGKWQQRRLNGNYLLSFGGRARGRISANVACRADLHDDYVMLLVSWGNKKTRCFVLI